MEKRSYVAAVALSLLTGCASTPSPMAASGGDAHATSTTSPAAAEPVRASPAAHADVTSRAAVRLQAERGDAAGFPAIATRRGALVYDDMPEDAVEVYQDDLPIAVDVGDAVPTDVGVHKIAIVRGGIVVWAANIRVDENATAHVHIPKSYVVATPR